MKQGSLLRLVSSDYFAVVLENDKVLTQDAELCSLEDAKIKGFISPRKVKEEVREFMEKLGKYYTELMKNSDREDEIKKEIEFLKQKDSVLRKNIKDIVVYMKTQANNVDVTGDEICNMTSRNNTLDISRAVAICRNNTKRKLYRRDGLRMRGAEKYPISPNEAITLLLHTPSNIACISFYANAEEIVINTYDALDMF